MNRTAITMGVTVGLVLSSLVLLAPPCDAQSWYLNDDHPRNVWGKTDQYQQFTHVEDMADGCLSNGSSAYMDPDTLYYALTQELTGNYQGYTFEALLFMHNEYSGRSYPVISTLKVSQTSGSVVNWVTIGTDTVRVTHDGLPPPFLGPMHHRYLFGVCSVNTAGETLELVIEYGGASSDTAHTKLFWDGHDTFSSSVYCYLAGTQKDRVVCEYASGTHPAHPDTYWYDVTPISTRRDFHVRVYDGGKSSDYGPWAEPAGWMHTLHSVNGCERWATWYAPTSVESLQAFATYRFAFVNDNPKTWGEWATTVSGTTNPHVSVGDSSGAHGGQPDGYGKRVHVPKEPKPGTLPALLPLPDGYWEGDAIFDDFDGQIVIAICGETDSGTETDLYVWNGVEFTHLQALEGVSGEGSGALAWGDFNDDGQPDLAISGTTGSATRVTRVYRNDGGTLVWDGQVLTGLSHASVAWTDYDLDGMADLLTMGYDGTDRRAIIYEYDGMGSFVVVEELTGLTSGSADWGDIDGDGDPDLLTTGSDGLARETIVYLNDPPGTLTPVGSLGLPGIALSDAEWCDYDRDGDIDLAFTGETSGAVKMARVYRNDGGLVLTQVADVLSVYRSSCAWGDYNLDGDVDVAFCGYTGIGLYTRVYENTGTGFVNSGFTFPGVREGALAFCDIDGDCDCDFFMMGADWSTKYGQPYENTAIDWVGIPEDDPSSWSPDGHLLSVNRPNPFNPATTVGFVVPASGRVELAIYDLAGRRVKTLVDARLTASEYERTWDGTDEVGRRLPSGVYFLKLKTAAGADERKMVMVK